MHMPHLQMAPIKIYTLKKTATEKNQTAKKNESEEELKKRKRVKTSVKKASVGYPGAHFMLKLEKFENFDGSYLRVKLGPSYHCHLGLKRSRFRYLLFYLFLLTTLNRKLLLIN